MWVRDSVTPPLGIGIEVYPKQKTVVRTGNPVKIPLGVHKKTGKRCFFVRNDFTEYEDQWEILQSIEPMTKEAVDSLISEKNIYITEFTPPPSSNPKRDMICMTRVMEEGLEEGIRDVGFFRLALFLKDRGLPHNAAIAVMEETNRLSNSAFDAIEDKAFSAYNGDYSVFPCFDPAFDSYCSSTCPFFAKKKRDRGHNDERIIKQLSRD
jgi:hypothetical protein